MSDQNTNDSEQLPPPVDEFDFGEAETTENRSGSTTPTPPRSPGSSNKKVIVGAILVGIAILAHFLLKPAPKKTTSATSASSANTAAATPDAKAVGNNMPPKLASKEMTAPKPTSTKTAAVTAPALTPQMPAPHETAVAKPNPADTHAAHVDQGFGDIAGAFSSNEHVSDPHPMAQPKPMQEVSSAKPAETTAHKDASIQSLKQELFTPEKTVAPAASPNAMANSNVAANKSSNAGSPDLPSHQEVLQLSDGLNKLNHQIDYILNQIKYLDSYSREVSDNLNKLNDSISTMDNRISTLTSTTSSLSKDMGSVRNEVGQVKQVLREDGLDLNVAMAATPKKSNPKESKVAIEEPEYTVHAVIPGRAWLKSSKGQIVTVAEGDTIGNYGKILVIDAVNGVVLTSSGIAFR